MKYKHLFGPVLSRRLGLSLGIDLIPYIVCSLDCVYCEVGRTNHLTLDRSNYIPINEILEELDDYLASQPKLNYITFSGAGEPTLHAEIEKVIQYIKSHYPKYPLALITNSTLLSDENIRNDVKEVDLILPSLDAVSEPIFDKINRHHPDLKAAELVNGLIEFRKIFKGKIFLEIFIIEGLNDTEAELSLLKEACRKIQPDKIQLNTLDRPGTEEWVTASSKENLLRIKALFEPLPVEIIAKISISKDAPVHVYTQIDDITELIKRRPCTLKEIMSVMDLHVNTVIKYLRYLTEQGIICEKKEDRGIFYKINTEKNDEEKK